MSRPRSYLRRLLAFFTRDRLEREMDEEMRFHVEMEAEELAHTEGLDPKEARRRALVAFGGVEQAKERAREVRRVRWVEELIQDVRHGLRAMRHSPGFAAVAVLTLALGIGSTTAIFSAVKPILFEPLPYPDSDRILTISDVATDGSPLDVTFGSYREVVERGRSFDALAAMKPWRPTLTGRTRPERLEGQRVSADYFRVLGVSPVIGRDFDPADDRVGGPDVAIIGAALWRGRFGGDSTIVGRRITLDGEPYTVIGVMAPGFENVPAQSARIWSLLQYDASLPSFDGREWGHHLRMLGRLRGGVEGDRAERELDGIATTPVPEFPRPVWSSLDRGFHVTSLKDSATRAARPTLLVIVGAVTLLLLVASVNVVNLLLARGTRRREELAMRSALGARRPRLIRQVLTESLLLAALGGAVGVLLATLGVRTLVALSPPGLPRVNAIQMDGTVFLTALVVTAVIGVAVGLGPALAASRSDPRRSLKQRSGRTARGHRLTRGTLVVAEVALTLVLLVGAGLLFRSLDHLFAVDPGFRAARTIALQVPASPRRFADDGAMHRFYAQALDAVRSVPGVAEAALTSQLPLSGEADTYGVQTAESAPSERPEASRGAFRYAVGPRYFETMGIPLRAGRVLQERDVAGAPPVVVISESLARRRFPGRDPIGRRMHVGRTDRPSYTVVGVVRDVKQRSLAMGPSDAVYVTPSQWYFADDVRWLVVRARRDAAELVPALEAAIWSVDADQPIVRVATMERLVAASAAERRFALTLFEAFALAALVLAAIGLYGVLSAGVAERRHEIGVRSALGATREDVLALIVRQGMTLTALGVVIGLGGAVALSGALGSMLFGISRFDPITYVGVLVILAAVAAVACAVPAWRAARVDPTTTLRAE